MTIFTPHQDRCLRHNGSPANRGRDHTPVAKVTSAESECTWLFSEIRTDLGKDYCYGIAEYRQGGMLQECLIGLPLLARQRDQQTDQPMAVDPHFVGQFPLSVYLYASDQQGKIIEDRRLLELYAKKLASRAVIGSEKQTYQLSL